MHGIISLCWRLFFLGRGQKMQTKKWITEVIRFDNPL